MEFGGLFILIRVAVSGKKVTAGTVNRKTISRCRSNAKYHNLNRENYIKRHKYHRDKIKSYPAEANILKRDIDPLKVSASEKT